MGKKPVLLPSGVTAAVSGNKLSVKGPKGELSITLSEPIGATVDAGKVSIACGSEAKKARSLHGLIRTKVSNMVVGVTAGYQKELEIQGVGFKAEVRGKTAILALGFSGPVQFEIPDGVNVKVNGGTSIVVSGIDKESVGDAAARIRSFYPAEPYKGKGVRYKGEYVRRKVGKTVA